MVALFADITEWLHCWAGARADRLDLYGFGGAAWLGR